jgi:hypothetical protein
VKITGSWTLVPGITFIGKGKLPNEKAAPISDLEEIRSIVFPVFDSLTEKELEPPSWTFPKS